MSVGEPRRYPTVDQAHTAGLNLHPVTEIVPAQILLQAVSVWSDRPPFSRNVKARLLETVVPYSSGMPVLKS